MCSFHWYHAIPSNGEPTFYIIDISSLFIFTTALWGKSDWVCMTGHPGRVYGGETLVSQMSYDSQQIYHTTFH